MTEPQNEPARPLGPDDWAGDMGQTWLHHLDQFEGMIGWAGQALINHAAFQPGERVIDIGPGGGATSLAIGALVGPRGLVLGVDISPDLVAEAQRRAMVADLGNVCFIAGDAARITPEEAPFDRLVSRFGCMFFADPFPAFAHLHSLIRPGGRIDLAVSQLAKDDEWLRVQAEIIGRHIDLPKPVPRAPGPVAMGEPDYARALLEHGGFREVTITGATGDQLIGGAAATPEQAADFVLSAHSIGQLLAFAPGEVQRAAWTDLRDYFRARHTPRGVVMEGRIWLVSAVA